ncbi:hypothetical protein REPUB_Repub06bG0180900 [Reevesia pubescens]
MGPLSAAFGDEGFFCAIDASGKQEVICWTKNSSCSSSSSTTSSTSTSLLTLDSASQVPPMAALSEAKPVLIIFAGFERIIMGLNVGGLGQFQFSSVAKRSGFMALASSDFTTCGIREDDLVLDCWSGNASLQPDYNPPVELCSPGLCRPTSCSEREFAFNASNLNEPDLTSLWVRTDLQIFSPLGSNCSDGFLLILLGWCLLPRLFATKREEGTKKQFKSCIGKPELDADTTADSFPPLSVTPCPGTAQIFRLSELKDATNGFKEFNELGRGSYGFVYKAVLADGRQVAVKKANAATMIHTNSCDFEMELEILCNLRHCNIVYLLGYCSEMGERLLVYEYMPHGKAAAIIDRYIALSRNVEPLLKLANIAESALREDPSERPTISDMVNLLLQIVKDGLVL